MSTQTLLAFVGGFLGAGKTTLIAAAAAVLLERGKRVAVVTNDQDSGLVDTALLRARNLPVSEVAGGCFCCRFSDLLAGAAQLSAYQPDVIFAEPVGSCIDLSATILQPLLAYHRQTFRLAPLTVLIDPSLLGALRSGELPAASEYLFRAQIAEADLLCLTKQDQNGDALPVPFPIDFRLSARTGAGVSQWVDEIQASRRVVGARLLEVDYARYAEAEASLGWLNLHAEVELSSALSPASVVGPLLEELDRRLIGSAIRLAHLKIFDRAASGWIKAAITSAGQEPSVEGDLLAGLAARHELALNLRAPADPATLRDLVERALDHIPGNVQVRHLGAFRPPPPVPEHRFAARAT